MNDFQDDPNQAKKRAEANAKSQETESIPQSPLREASGVKASRMSILEDMHEGKESIIKYKLNTESMDLLCESLLSIKIHDLNEESRKMLYAEIKDACSQILSKLAHKKEISLESLGNLSEVLSASDFQALLDTYGSFSLGVIGVDILNALPEIDRFEGAAYLERIIAPEGKHKEILSDPFLAEQYDSDPIARLLFNLEADIKEALLEVDEFFEQYWNGKRRKPFKSVKEKAEYLKLKALKIKKKKEKAKNAVLSFHSFIIFVLCFFILGFFGADELIRITLSVLAGVGGYFLRKT